MVFCFVWHICRTLDWNKVHFLLTWPVPFLHRCSVCLGSCGETSSQIERERRGPKSRETIPVKDCPPEPPVSSYTQLAASPAEAPGKGMDQVLLCGCFYRTEWRGKSRNSHITECQNQTKWVINFSGLTTKALSLTEWGRMANLFCVTVTGYDHMCMIRASWVIWGRYNNNIIFLVSSWLPL